METIRMTTSRQQPLRYVHIEDKEADAALVQRALLAGGYDPLVQRVETADELAAALQQPGWDLVLADWSLPRFSAKAALDKMAGLAVDLPIIIVSGTVGEETAVDALKAGAHNYVMKDRLVRLVPAVQQALREAVERKAFRQVEEALARSKERQELATRAADIGMWDWNIPKNELVWDDQMFALYGVKRDDFGGNYDAWLSRVHPDDRTRCDKAIQQALRNEKLYDIEFRVQRPDGTLRVIKADGLVAWDTQGSPLRLMGVNYDITERKRAEDRLRLSEFSIDRAGEAIYWIDPFARILDVNDAACAMLGYVKEELCVMTVHDIAPDLQVDVWPAHWMEVKRRGAFMFEGLHRAKDGRIIPIEMSVNYLCYDGQEYNCAFVRNITERKRTEAALRRAQAQLIQAQKMEAIGRLAGGIAHDFNNLLTVINGHSDVLLADQTVPDRVRKSIEQVQDAGRRAAGLTRQLLVFSRQQVVQLQLVDLNQIVTAMQKLLVRLIGADIRIRLDLDNSLDRIMADPSQVEQIVMNLTVNARDSMPRGGDLVLETRNVELDAAFFEQQGMVSTPGPYCMLSMRDTGTGMDEQTAGRIFEPFFTTKDPGKGTGLGLATVYGIVRQSQGVITLSTQLGQGATFRIYFPRDTAATRQDVATASEPAATLGGRETILLIEDHPLVRELVKVVLSSRGYTVLEAGDGKAALDISSGHQGEIHLVLSDVILPGERGPIVVDRLRAIRRGMKALFMSGYLGGEFNQEDIQIYQSSFLQKPFTTHVLLQKVRLVLDSAETSPVDRLPPL
jgi:two-component system, cell cycle sensor histidine kinase and response regulator CckA